MKKLMIATAAAALAGSVFAVPEVYDFKASVKHMYLKHISLSTKLLDGTKWSGKVYQKFVKGASLKGYLVQDVDGATSRVLGDNQTATGFDYGANRAFLVVMNSSAEAAFKQPKILPAVIDAKFIDTNFKKNHMASTGLAEGYLYVGGDAIAPVRPQLDFTMAEMDDNGNIVDVPVSRGAEPPLPDGAAGDQVVPGMVAISDYVWTSVYLFGRYNGPNWYKTGNQGLFFGPYDAFETKWNNTLPTDLQRAQAAGGVSFYHDTWMNGAGFGKYLVPTPSTVKEGDLCCGLTPDTTVTLYRAVLSQITGAALKGGIFICTDNGVDADPANKDYRFFDQWLGGRDAWDAQFYSSRLVPALGDELDFEGDKWQFDLWQDGFFEQETTDVAAGTWSITRVTTKFFGNKGAYEKYGELTNAEIAALALENEDFDPETASYEAANGLLWLEWLVGSLKAATLSLDPKATFIDGVEIYEYNALKQVGKLPVVTPQFAKYYGLADWE